jgi:hypothetical protein
VILTLRKKSISHIQKKLNTENVYNVTVKTDSGSEPVTEAVIKNFIKYDESDTVEINLILSMVKSAREMIEKFLNVSLKSKTYVMEFDYRAMDDNYLKIPYGPVVSVTSLIDSESVTLVSGTDYFQRGVQWKEIYMPYVNEDVYYTLEYISGFGGALGIEVVPEVLKEAICETVKYWYDREEGAKVLPETVSAKISAYNHNFWI